MYASGIGKGLAQIFFGVLSVVALIVCLLTWGITYLATGGDEKVVSKTRIEPEIQLIIEDNQVDTLYIYREP